MDGAYESATSRDFKTPAAVQGPKGVRFSLHTTNFKLQYNHRGATETTYSSTFKSLPTSRAQILRPRTSVRTSFNGKLPEPTYRTTYTPHEVSPVLRVKESAQTANSQGSTKEPKWTMSVLGVSTIFCNMRHSIFLKASCDFCHNVVECYHHGQKVGGVLVELRDDDGLYDISFGLTVALPPPKLTLLTLAYRSPFLQHTSVNRTVDHCCIVEVLRLSQYAKLIMSITDNGVGLSLNQEKKNLFSSATQEAYQRRRPMPCPPLESIEKQHVQFSSVLLGDREKIVDTQTSYSSSFKSHGYDKKCLLPTVKKNPPINLREMSMDQWMTSSKEEFRPHKPEAPVLLERRHRNASNILKVEIPKDRQEKVSTTNQHFFPELTRPEFPVHVDGPSIRTNSRVYFGKPGAFYRTTAQDHFPVKEGVCAKPTSHPPSRMLQEQEPEPMLTSTQKDFVFQNGGRHKLNQSELQRVRDSHIRFQEAKPDYSTTHGEMFVPKPYLKLPKIHSFVRNISHMPF
ncbi:hypothetical protein DNTS_006126 [Danionella cerebrum]|uniref:Uncharacterized protein n=1 Tax=Danionella cerebrum TaxID=2873325 RepID=A0A553QU81_9TELE|nr:hypothetical protein DNTS_006126 [Danionella translucida]